MISTLQSLTVGMPVLWGGDRVTLVSPDLAAAFSAGDRLIVVQDSGALLHVPAAIHALATEIILLDRNMRSLGADGDEVRGYLKAYLADVLRETEVMEPDPQAESALEAAGLRLRSIRTTDDQKLAVWNDGRQLYRQVERDRWVAIGAAGGTIPGVLVATLIAWLAAIFAGVGYRAPRNVVVTTTFVVAALLLSSALSLILEMDRPASGLIRISNEPFARALAQLQR